MSESVTLYYNSYSNTTLLEALQQHQKCFELAVGLFYSPIECQFGEVRGTIVANKNLKGVFEARIFNENAELRWLQESAGKGKAVLLFESNDVTQNYPKTNTVSVIHTLDGEYLLWGQGNNQPAFNGWSNLSEARIGQLAVPISNIKEKDRVALHFREYFEECDDHGNVAVIEERLIGLTKQPIVNN
jgi:CRISPR-associated protein (TIGR03984 family)